MIARRAGNNKVRNEIRDSIKVESVANSSLTAKEEREELLVRPCVGNQTRAKRWTDRTRSICQFSGMYIRPTKRTAPRAY